MTTPASPNSISFTQIVNEFGSLKTNSNQTGTDIGAYRVYQNVDGISYRLDEGVPFIGQISFDDLRNKSLNVVVDVNGGTRVWGRDPWNNNDVTVIGGGTGKKEGGSRIIIHVKGTVQSEQGTHPIGNSGSGNRWSAALRTGTWSNIVSLDVIVGPGNNNGYIRGGGGNGGAGGTSDGETNNSEQEKADGLPGCHGTSALGLGHNIRNLVVNSNSRIVAGGGGGGGGGGAMGEGAESIERAGGGGGGGGMGSPAGNGGAGGGNNGGVERVAQSGFSGNTERGGNGGYSGINNENENSDSADGGGGGGGGGINSNNLVDAKGGAAEEGAENGFDGYGMAASAPDTNENPGRGGTGGRADAEGSNQQTGDGGLGGGFGAAILRDNFSITSITGNNRIYGNQRDNPSPT